MMSNLKISTKYLMLNGIEKDKFKTNPARLENRDELLNLIEERLLIFLQPTC
jgi:hypothetical protein